MSETPDLSKTATETLNGYWRQHGLDRIKTGLALDATITAQTLAATEGSSPQTAPKPNLAARSIAVESLTDSIPSLPMIALSLAADGSISVPPHAHPSLATKGAQRADFEAKGVLGEGGMGRVLLANQRSLQREVAVKVLKPEAITPGVVRALLIEALTAGSLEHPNIIPIHALGTDASGHPLLVMKRVDGVSWRTVLSDPAHPAWKQLTETTTDHLVASVIVLMEVCNAVQFAHDRDIVHRDIKPENVMLGIHGEVYLVDWGIAVRKRDEQTQALVGTPCYMAPEMIVGDTALIDARTDVYLLGATLHEVLTGFARHEGENLYATIFAALESKPYTYEADVPSELASLANRSCSALPADRPQSVREFRASLAEWIRHRASATLASNTTARATELAPLAELAKQGDPAARASFDRIATESRFGFTQALKDWSENPVAILGLHRCLVAMVELEIARENPENARSILSEMLQKDDALILAVSQLEQSLSTRKEAGQKGALLARELDHTVAIRERTILLMTLLFLGASVGIYMAVRGNLAAVSVAKSIKFGSIVFSAMCLAVVGLRKKLFANAFNRRVVGVVLISFGAMVLHRVLAYFRGVQVLAEVLADDMLMIAAVVTLAGVTIQRWFAAVGAVLILTSVVISVFPQKASLVFSIGPFIAIFLGVVLHQRTFGANAKPSGFL